MNGSRSPRQYSEYQLYEREVFLELKILPFIQIFFVRWTGAVNLDKDSDSSYMNGRCVVTLKPSAQLYIISSVERELMTRVVVSDIRRLYNAKLFVLILYMSSYTLAKKSKNGNNIRQQSTQYSKEKDVGELLRDRSTFMGAQDREIKFSQVKLSSCLDKKNLCNKIQFNKYRGEA